MREILFRGKRVDNGEWVEGLLWKKKYNTSKLFMSYFPDKDDNEEVVVIDPETVGQYTGLKDKNGNKIFEGDIVKWIDTQFNAYKSKVIYCCDKYNYPAFDLEKHDYECNGLQYAHEDCYLEIIGNIHDNPELLQED